jgi:hypothetical protein
MSISAIGVVIPARDEEARLGRCLDALAVAIERVWPVVVTTVVVLDSCVDASPAIAAARPWVTTASIGARNVGQARRAGVEVVMRQLAALPADEIWLANTDADSCVPPAWLQGQLALAADGFDAVVGTVAVLDWSDHHAEARTRWTADYLSVEQHTHVHGANLGLSAAAYAAVGGWPRLPAHEDVELVRRLSRHRILATSALPVVTSARRDPRAAGGFGDTVKRLAAEAH